MVFTLQIADDGGGLVGDQLRAHRGDHVLLGKNACRRLAKILPYLVKDSGTAAVVNYPLAERHAHKRWRDGVVVARDGRYDRSAFAH